MGQTYFVCAVQAFFLIYHMHSFPYIEEKHNVMDGVGQTALLLTYCVSLILRNKDETEWANEWFPREGYGWFLAFQFFVVLPAPVIIYFRINQKLEKQTVDGTTGDEIAIFDNPLPIDGEGFCEDEEDDCEATAASSPVVAPPAATNRMRATPRSTRLPSGPTKAIIRAPLAKAHREIEVLHKKIQGLMTDKHNCEETIQSLKGALEDARTNGEDMATSTLNFGAGSALPGGKNATLGFGLERITELKALVEDGTLSDETWKTTTQHLEKQVAIDLQKLESAQDKELRHEHFYNAHQDTSMMSEQVNILRQEAQQQGGDASTAIARESLRHWLASIRLIHHELKFVEVGGRGVAVEDMRLCRDEEIEELSTDMTFFEKARLKVAIEDLQSSEDRATE